jgi:hypothetical protein
MGDVTASIYEYNENPLAQVPADLTALRSFIEFWPGGNLIGDRWQAEEFRIVGVDMQNGPSTGFSNIFGRAVAAYPPAVKSGSVFLAEHGLFRGTVLFHVPRMVADLLEWHGEPENETVQVLSPEPGDLPITAEVIRTTVALWAEHGLEELEDAFDAVAQIWDAAKETGLDEDALRQSVVTLVTTEPFLGFEVALEACSAVLERD